MRERSVDQLRLVLYSLDSNTDRGVTYDGISKTISHDLDHHDRHGHRDRVLSLRAKLQHNSPLSTQAPTSSLIAWSSSWGAGPEFVARGAGRPPSQNFCEILNLEKVLKI
jgi:hypothetical protein